MLHDLYCLVNRVSGFELIEPSRLLRVLDRESGELTPRIQIKRIRGGDVILAHSANYSLAKLSNQFLQIVSESLPGGASAVLLSRKLVISPSLGIVYLREMVADGTLCIDECADGLFFFPNTFI